MVEKPIEFMSEYETDEINYLKRLFGEYDEDFEAQ